MRVTNGMMVNSFMNDMYNNLGNMSTIQKQLNTGKLVNKPSDDPLKVSRVMQLRRDLEANAQYKKNIDTSINYLATADTAMAQMGGVIKSINESLISAGNGSYSKEERTALKNTINEQIGHLGQILNTSFDGKFVFGGTRTDEKPVIIEKDANGNNVLRIVDKDGFKIDKDGKTFDAANNEIKKITDAKGNTVGIENPDGTTVDLNGDPLTLDPTFKINDVNPEYNQLDSKLVVEISQGITLQYTSSVTDIFSFKGSDGTQKDIRNLLSDILTNLDSDNPDDIDKLTNENLKDIEAFHSHVLKTRSSIGSMQNRMDDAKAKNADETFNLTEILSTTEDIDLTEKLIESSVMQSVYQASLMTAAKVLQPTLIDYMR